MSSKAWWRPGNFAKRRAALETRAGAIAAIRAYFGKRGFVEVETPYLQVSPGMEPHIMALSTELHGPLGDAHKLYFHTSPEFAMKKLLVAGVPRLYQLARVWRDGERSPLHHPEFTMLEWYRAHAIYETLMEDCEGLLRAAATATGKTELRRGERRCDPHARAERLSVAKAFERFCGIDLLATVPDPLKPDAVRLRAAAETAGLYVSENDTWEDIFFRVMLERIEPNLGDGAPTVLYEYPISMAALSRPSVRDTRVAERFELYVCGVELANAFGELTDAAEQRRRFEADAALKEKLYGVRYPIDEDFLSALAHGMPPSSGIAFGVDRLVMLLAGAETIDEVLWAPVVE